jgi:hypothetical protein
MRQVADLMVWLGVILVVAAVIYFTPRFAHYASGTDPDQSRAGLAWRRTIAAEQAAESKSLDENP